MTIMNRNLAQVIKTVAGTGASQAVAHGLGRTPAWVDFMPLEEGIVEASFVSADKTNVNVIITNLKSCKLRISL